MSAEIRNALHALAKDVTFRSEAAQRDAFDAIDAIPDAPAPTPAASTVDESTSVDTADTGSVSGTVTAPVE